MKKIDALSDLKAELESRGIEIQIFNGHTLITGIGDFMLATPTLFWDGNAVDMKEFDKQLDEFTKDEKEKKHGPVDTARKRKAV